MEAYITLMDIHTPNHSELLVILYLRFNHYIIYTIQCIHVRFYLYTLPLPKVTLPHCVGVTMFTGGAGSNSW